MHRGPLQNAADNLCEIFCGWRLTSSKRRLEQLGSGILEIDAKSGACRFQGEEVAQLPIAEEICAWFRQHLATHRISESTVKFGRLKVRLTFSIVPWQEASGEVFYLDGKPYETETMNHCVFECQSAISTAEGTFNSTVLANQSWPVGWPQLDTQSSFEKPL